MPCRNAHTRYPAALPVLASGETAIGRVEIHGEGDFLRRCLDRPTDGPPTCPVESVGGDLIADWVIDGAWYVAVVSMTVAFTANATR